MCNHFWCWDGDFPGWVCSYCGRVAYLVDGKLLLASRAQKLDPGRRVSRSGGRIKLPSYDSPNNSLYDEFG